MLETRRGQTTFADGLIAEEVSDLWEPWMRHSDAVLEDEQLVEIVCQALSKRCKKSKTRGRKGTPAEVVLRLLALKHMFNWSYDELHREVRANLVYREFTRIGGGKVPDDKTLGRLARQLGPEPVEQLHRRLVAIALDKKIVEGRKLRVDTTVVETNIHYPTDSSLMGDGVRVLTRLMKRITEVAGAAGTKLRDRTRSVKWRVVEIARASRSKSEQGRERMKGLYEKLLSATAAVVGQAQRFAKDIAEKVKHSSDVMQQAALEALQKELETMAPRVKQVIRQTRARVLHGNPHAEGKLVSIFEPTTEVIRRGKAKQPTEFGKTIKVQEAEAQIITSYEVYEKRPATLHCWCQPSRYIRNAWAAFLTWWRETRGFTRRTGRSRPMRWESSGFRCPIARPRARSEESCRRHPGSSKGRSGEPDAKAGLACSSGAMD